MWPLAIAGIVGTAASLFSGISQGSAAKAARNEAMQAYQRNQQIAQTLEARQEALVDRPLEQRIQEMQSLKPTAEGQQALNQFSANIGQAERSITQQAPTTGYGVAGARSLNAQFQRAQGIAGINLGDQARKDSELTQLLHLGEQTPGWAGVAAGANQQIGGYQAGLAELGTSASNSSYAAAANGLVNLAKLYATPQLDQATAARILELKKQLVVLLQQLLRLVSSGSGS